jgi:hypothetical protein
VDGELKRLEKQVHMPVIFGFHFIGMVLELFNFACMLHDLPAGWTRSRLSRRAAKENGGCRLHVQSSDARAN